MTSRNERWYHLQRAQDSLRRSREAGDPVIAALHMEFYELYMKRAGASLSVDPRSTKVDGT